MTTVYNFGLNITEFKLALYLLAGMMIYELTDEKYGERMQQRFYAQNMFVVRWIIYLILIFAIIFLGSYGTTNDNSFIYFQF